MGEYTQDNRYIQITTPLGKDELLLNSFNGQEAISQLFRFDLRLHSENRSVKFEELVGKKATIKIVLPDGSERFINGILSSFAQGGSSPLRDGQTPTVFAHYYATLVPWMWMLTRTVNCRIFQNLSVPDILVKVFKDRGFSDFKLRLYGSFEPREYCVQYRETDFNFVSRLMEEEGIFYFFEHEADKHNLILANRSNEFQPCPLAREISYKSVTGEARDWDIVSEWNASQEVRTGQVTMTDFNFEQPGLDLTSNVTGKDPFKYEIYDYPGEYRKKDQGQRLVGIRQEEEDTTRELVNGSGTCRGFVSGYKFDLKDHYRRDFNKSYVLTSIYHSADQGDNYRSSDEQAGEALQYTNQFQCIPATTPFRPRRTSLIPVVHGSQTAIVVGPSGEEIYVDKYGRVKVQFHWDRDGQYDEHSSCWVRVSQNWAGKRWGAMFIPRIGQEVIVDFLEGDPDQPIITGRVYNGDSMPPYALPDEKTKSTVKSYSSKGGEGFNEIRFEDKKGDEQFFIHAEKDEDIRVKNDAREWIGRDRHLVVKRDLRELIERDEHILIKRDLVEEVDRDHHLTIKGKESVEIKGSQSLSVTGNVAEEFKANHTEQVTGNYYLKAMQVVIEASVGMTLKVGGNFITLNPAGIQMNGMPMMLLNSGGAPLVGIPGMLVPPTAPSEAEIADNADPGSKEPSYKQQRESMSPSEAAASSAPSHSSSSSSNNESSSNSNSNEENQKKTWIEIELTDDKGKPVPGEKYRVTLPDGSTLAEGTLDEKGFARVDGIDPGNCQVTFPNLDKEAWKPK